ncbi:hypothetical protein [Kineosporia babensis]|uniref:Uncharacterized protein n=1 Tax=Kineosporia babensis TaxID=499548 RepID=A0A9X1STE1_9ACTN|nr:hypothetical protein [Kineosporia babensis]MCD5311769.1 hypothetical protein [Kineosporia babensis]
MSLTEPLTEQELDDVIAELLIDFPQAQRSTLDEAVHSEARQAPGDSANQIEQAVRMRLHLSRQGDH